MSNEWKIVLREAVRAAENLKKGDHFFVSLGGVKPNTQMHQRLLKMLWKLPEKFSVRITPAGFKVTRVR